MSLLSGRDDTTTATAEWVLSLVEQGCVPVLRMAAGRRLQPQAAAAAAAAAGEGRARGDAPRAATTAGRIEGLPSASAAMVTLRAPQKCAILGASTAALRTAEQPRCLRGPRGRGEHRGGQRATGANEYDEEGLGGGLGSQGGGEIAVEVIDEEWGERLGAMQGGVGEGVGGSVHDGPREAARCILEVLSREACTRHLDGLSRSVRESGSRELRANVAVALVILSTETSNEYASEVGRGGFS